MLTKLYPAPYNFTKHTHTESITFSLFAPPPPPPHTHTHTHYAALSCRLVCSFTPNMASHCVLTQASRPWRSSPLSERTHHVLSCFTVCRKHTRESMKIKAVNHMRVKLGRATIYNMLLHKQKENGSRTLTTSDLITK